MSDTGDDTLQGLVEVIGTALSNGGPLDVLGLASATLAVVVHPPAERADTSELSRERVVEELVGQAVAIGTTPALALATALTELVAEEALRRRLRATLDGVESEVPPWLARLDDARLARTTVVHDLFDDDEWLLAEVRPVDGDPFSFRIEIDHDADAAVTDGSLMPTTVDDVTARLRSGPGADEVAVTEHPADEVRRRYAEGVAAADALDPAPRSDTWPACRPLVEWALRRTADG